MTTKSGMPSYYFWMSQARRYDNTHREWMYDRCLCDKCKTARKESQNEMVSSRRTS